MSASLTSHGVVPKPIIGFEMPVETQEERWNGACSSRHLKLKQKKTWFSGQLEKATVVVKRFAFGARLERCELRLTGTVRVNLCNGEELEQSNIVFCRQYLGNVLEAPHALGFGSAEEVDIEFLVPAGLPSSVQNRDGFDCGNVEYQLDCICTGPGLGEHKTSRQVEIAAVDAEPAKPVTLHNLVKDQANKVLSCVGIKGLGTIDIKLQVPDRIFTNRAWHLSAVVSFTGLKGRHAEAKKVAYSASLHFLRRLQAKTMVKSTEAQLLQAETVEVKVKELSDGGLQMRWEGKFGTIKEANEHCSLDFDNLLQSLTLHFRVEYGNRELAVMTNPMSMLGSWVTTRVDGQKRHAAGAIDVAHWGQEVDSVINRRHSHHGERASLAPERPAVLPRRHSEYHGSGASRAHGGSGALLSPLGGSSRRISEGTRLVVVSEALGDQVNLTVEDVDNNSERQTVMDSSSSAAAAERQSHNVEISSAHDGELDPHDMRDMDGGALGHDDLQRQDTLQPAEASDEGLTVPQSSSRGSSTRRSSRGGSIHSSTHRASMISEVAWDPSPQLPARRSFRGSFFSFADEEFSAATDSGVVDTMANNEEGVELEDLPSAASWLSDDSGAQQRASGMLHANEPLPTAPPIPAPASPPSTPLPSSNTPVASVSSVSGKPWTLVRLQNVPGQKPWTKATMPPGGPNVSVTKTQQEVRGEAEGSDGSSAPVSLPASEHKLSQAMSMVATVKLIGVVDEAGRKPVAGQNQKQVVQEVIAHPQPSCATDEPSAESCQPEKARRLSVSSHSSNQTTSSSTAPSTVLAGRARKLSLHKPRRMTLV